MKKTMFQKLRHPDSNKSPLTYIFFALIFGMIIIVFAFMTPNGVGGLSGSATAATVGGRVIPILQLQQLTQQIEEQSKMFFPNVGNQFQELFQRQALNQLINSEVLAEMQNKEGLYVSDSMLAKAIMDVPNFQEKGKFRRDLYENFLTNSGMSANILEEKFKKDLRTQMVNELFKDSFLTTNIEKDILSSMSDFKIKMDYLDLSENEISKSITVTSADVSAALKKPEFVKKAEQAFSQNAFMYQPKEKIKAKWILVLATNPTEAGFKEAKGKLTEYTKDLNATNFSEKAKAHSDDITASQGGDLGYVERGIYEESWDEVAFATEKGQISKPFKTEQGWAVLLVEDKKTPSEVKFNDVKDQVAKEVLVKEKVDVVLQMFKENINNTQALKKEVAKMGLAWKTTPEFLLSDRVIPGFGESELVFEKILSLKKDGEVYSDLIPYDGKSFLIRRNSFNFKKDSDYQPVTGTRQNYALSDWFDQQREKIKIKINPILQPKQLN